MAESRRVILNDSTLRDGEQAPGVAFTLDEKLAIAKALEEAGVDEIEAGTPAMGDREVEEIAATDEVAASQAASLATLITLARGFTDPLAQNPANNELKQVLATAAVSQKRNRVVVTATLSPALLNDLTGK